MGARVLGLTHRCRGGGAVFVDERDLWPSRAFASTVLVATLQQSARSARSLGFLQSDDIAGLVVDTGAR